jgi:hypothetical protein
MAIDTTYGAGGVQTNTTSPGLQVGGGDMDFWREMARRSMANMQPKAAAPTMARRASGGGRPITRENVRSSGPRHTEMGYHSFVADTPGLGLAQSTMGSRAGKFMDAPSGPGTVYGGWRPGPQMPLGPLDPYRVQQGTPQHTPGGAEAQAMHVANTDPAMRAISINEEINKGRRADYIPGYGRG